MARTSVIERYHNDAAFKTLVDMLYHSIDQAQLSPTEIREAAMFAHIMWEERHIRPILIDDVRTIQPWNDIERKEW